MLNKIITLGWFLDEKAVEYSKRTICLSTRDLLSLDSLSSATKINGMNIVIVENSDIPTPYILVTE